MTPSRCVFFVLCIQVVGQVLSETPPASPQNIHVDNWLLTWTPGTEEGNVAYTVQYRSFDADMWRDVPSCVHITFKSCNVTLTKAEAEHGCVMLRVQAERRGLTSRPVQACSRHGDSCTPEVSLTARPGSLTIHLSRNHSLAVEHGDHAKHRVYFGKDGEPLKKLEDAISSVSIHDLQERQRYCTKVQYIYFNKSVGLASCTLCEVIPESRKDTKHKETIVAVVVVVVVLVILIPLIAYILIFQCGRIKQWLRPPFQIPEDFMFEPFPVYQNPSSPSEERLDVISCIIPEFRE